MSLESPLFARQAIFDVNKNVIAYELLFRNLESNYADHTDGDHASSHVLLNVFGDHKLENVIGGHRAFINYTRNLLISPPNLPKEKVVIEVLEDIEADEEVMKSLKLLQDSGYQIALDDFFLNRDTKKMLQFADIIKVDVLSLSDSKLKRYVNILKPLKVKLLAEKIEDHQMLNNCIDLGFDYFQGYFLCKPEIIRGARINTNRQSMLRLIGKLNQEDVQHEEVVEAISTDAALSYKILKLVNSPAVGLSAKIESLSQAVTLLGIDQVKNWATFLLMASNDDKPTELGVITMCRAKLCEHLGRAIGGPNLAQTCFTIGLLSNLDSFLDMELIELVSQLQLAENIENALLKTLGEEGQILANVYQYERGDWKGVDWRYFDSKNINAGDINAWYIESISWAVELVQS